MALSDYVLDNGLVALQSEASHLYICSQDPTSYAEATTGGSYALGNKASPTLTGPTAASPDGEKVTVSQITDGTETNAGTATYWAIVNSSVSRLLATGPVTSHSIAGSGTFTLTSFEIRIPATVA